jgi:hypothetical protein
VDLHLFVHRDFLPVANSITRAVGRKLFVVHLTSSFVRRIKRIFYIAA